MKEIYLDNSATTMVLPQVAELMTKIYTRDYGNPSSMHHKGVEAEEHVLEAAKGRTHTAQPCCRFPRSSCR